MNCRNHPEVATHIVCTRCSAPLCESCVEAVDGKPYCAACAERLRARLAERQAPAATDAPPPLPAAEQAPASRPSWLGESGLGRAVTFASVAGAASLLMWYLLVTLTHAIAGLLAIAVGFIVGRAAFAGNGRDTDVRLGLISAAITVLTVLVGEYLVIRAHLGRASKLFGPGLLVRVPFFTFVGVWVDNVGALTLIGLVLGAGVAFLIPATGQPS